MTLDTKISSLGGVGRVREAAFARLGIFDVRGLLYHFPRAYQNRGDIKTVGELHDGETAALLLTVGTSPKTVMLPGRNRMLMTKFSAFDDTGRAAIVFFNSRYIEKSFEVGRSFRFFGKLTVKNGVKTLTAPAFEPFAEGAELPALIPVYPLTAGISNKFLADCVDGAINGLDERTEPPLPSDVADKFELCDFFTALRGIHFPSDFAELEAARRYFMTEELFMFALGVSMSRVGASTDKHIAPKIDIPASAAGDFFSVLPFEPTGAQKRAVDDILRDMTAGELPMNRLVSGDVGSGKTVCAEAAAYFSFLGGYQSAFMAPTEILACQHYADLSPLLSKLGMKTALLTGSATLAQKRVICDKLESGQIDLCIGTHALLSEGVRFNRLGLAITDEQHRFGVRQRSALSSASDNSVSPHVLVMSATPIPRTLALIIYGDLSASAIDELPPGRQKIDTFVVGENYRQRLNAFIAKQVGEGHQVYVVCPAVAEKTPSAEEGETDEGFDAGLYVPDSLISPEDERLPVKNAVAQAEYLRSVLGNIGIGLLHGKMKASEKEAVMGKFASGQLGVLVSTTVIEVGVNVPSATLMVVENAERFGLSQLHQLRGRVGRGNAKSYCVLVSDSKSENAKKRLAVMRETGDGYKIAQTDLELRGPGEFFPKSDGSARQHGELELKIANLCSDVDTLKAAFESAKEIAALDPELKLPCHAGLRAEVERMFNLRDAALN